MSKNSISGRPPPYNPPPGRSSKGIESMTHLSQTWSRQRQTNNVIIFLSQQYEIVGYKFELDNYRRKGYFYLPTDNRGSTLSIFQIHSLRKMSNSRRFRPALLVWPFVAHQYCQGVTCTVSKEGWEGSWQASTHEYNNISNIFTHPDSAVTHASRCLTLLKKLTKLT